MSITPAHVIDGPLLARTAFDILVSDLEGHGNILSAMHRAAMFELVDTFALYCTGKAEGRKAYPLPTGMGKTSAVVAFIAALHRLGYVVPLSVAASKVQALCSLKRDLLAHGVPEPLIGLKHASMEDTAAGILPSTGNESRPFQLVTHARVRSGRDFQLFGEHDGAPRALCIYDETFMRSDAFAFRARGFFAAVAVLAVEAEGIANPLLGQLVEYLQDSAGRIRDTLAQLQADGDPSCNGAAVTLAELEPGIIEAYRELVGRFAGKLRGFDADLQDLLALSRETLRVLGSEQGDGIVTAREAVPLTLRNVVVLDASAPIRELARLDPTVEVVESFSAADLKSFERVEVHQLLSPGGRSTISHSLRADREETSAVAREVAGIIRKGWATERAFLVFTFRKRMGHDLVEELKRDLRRAGIDTEAQTDDGHPRINWLTWGSETSLNGLEFCTAVIMAGVLHRSHLDLSAAVRGQTGNPAEPTPSVRIRQLIESELASAIYQGASRGSCRRIDAGHAVPMRLWLIHKGVGIRDILERVMPGAMWSYPEPQHLKKAQADTKAARLMGQVLAHLRGLPEGNDKVSSRALKAALGLPKDAASESAFTRAVGLLNEADHGWCLTGRSLVRGAEVYGFSAQES